MRDWGVVKAAKGKNTVYEIEHQLFKIRGRPPPHTHTHLCKEKENVLFRFIGKSESVMFFSIRYMQKSH